MRKLSYSLAINEALKQLMRKDSSVLLLGQGVKSVWYVGNTCKDLVKEFGDRVIDTPVSENATTGAGLGAALVGMKSIVMHPRMDFMLYALDPIINEAANWKYMFNEKASFVVWAAINRGGEQAAQHSQALQAMFSHIPGLKVVMPSNAYDAKGLMISAVNDNSPVIFIDDRWLYNLESEVPEEMYEVEIGKANLLKEGKDLTIVSSSYMTNVVLETDLDADIIDLRTIKPLDKALILNSVKKTGRLLIVDGGWKSFGVSAEISAMVSENILSSLKAPIRRLALPDCPAPASSALEEKYYISKEDILREAKEM